MPDADFDVKAAQIREYWLSATGADPAGNTVPVTPALPAFGERHR